MLPLPLVTQRRWHYFLILAAMAALPLLATWTLSKNSFKAINLQDYVSYRCEAANTDSDAAFRVLTLTSTYAIALAEALCQSALLSEQYASVEISWHPRGYLKAQDILEGNYQLIWNRRHVVEGLLPEVYQYYQPILDSPRYTLFWLSRKTPVAMNDTYFAGKRVGLSLDQHSQTYFLQPMNALRSANIDLDNTQIQYFSSIAALYDAFEQGQVDIISSARNPVLLPDQGGVVFTPLAEDVPSGSWFLRADLLGDPAVCDIIRALNVFQPVFDQAPIPLVEGGCP